MLAALICLVPRPNAPTCVAVAAVQLGRSASAQAGDRGRQQPAFQLTPGSETGNIFKQTTAGKLPRDLDIFIYYTVYMHT